MANYIVYRHTSPSGKVYIGITCKNPEKRWRKGIGYLHNSYFLNAIKKYGWDNIKHEVLFENLNEESALAIEEDLIYYYKQLGISYNITNRGAKTSWAGQHHTDETKQKMSSIAKELGRVPSRYAIEKSANLRRGKHLSEETKLKISEANKGKVLSEETKMKISLSKQGDKHPMWGKTHSEEAKKKISIGHSKVILQYDLDGSFIREWPSISNAAKELNIDNSAITKVCKGTLQKTKGFVFRYKE